MSAMAVPHNPRLARRTPWWVWALLTSPYIGLCFPSLYDRATPVLFGFPFFYWYQLGWVVLTSLVLYLAYSQLKNS